ncbi:hypothetical protein Biyabedamokiny2_00138 [Staphylococcus phage Biyabeda-mokiny_2]|nr:hypothetical protein Biyabedamokiny1_00062 [Staphylococcus phage Biyabeda-mokiny_1]UXE02708.1 hypothetical protein Biyabedamokiny2_00138 [Staphylococcus phage Biyabeda-mokiny_2]
MIVIYTDVSKDYLKDEFLPWLNERDRYLEYYKDELPEDIDSSYIVSVVYCKDMEGLLERKDIILGNSYNEPVALLGCSRPGTYFSNHFYYRGERISKNDLGEIVRLKAWQRMGGD